MAATFLDQKHKFTSLAMATLSRELQSSFLAGVDSNLEWNFWDLSLIFYYWSY